MVLTRWEPLRDLQSMEERLNRIWRGYGGDGDNAVENWSIPLDVVREGDNFTVHASLPGVNPDDIEVSVEDNVLTIRAKTEAEFEHQEGDYLMRERRVGTFHRAIHLPDSVDVERIQPTYKNGVLTITVPKAESKKAKRLKVQAQQ